MDIKSGKVKDQNEGKRYVEKLFRLQNDIEEGKEDEDSENEIGGWYPTGRGPDGISLQRNIGSLIVNYWINKVCMSYTNVAEF